MITFTLHSVNITNFLIHVHVMIFCGRKLNYVAILYGHDVVIDKSYLKCSRYASVNIIIVLYIAEVMCAVGIICND